jgi:hypothetical protein
LTRKLSVFLFFVPLVMTSCWAPDEKRKLLDPRHGGVDTAAVAVIGVCLW